MIRLPLYKQDVRLNDGRAALFVIILMVEAGLRGVFAAGGFPRTFVIPAEAEIQSTLQ